MSNSIAGHNSNRWRLFARPYEVQIETDSIEETTESPPGRRIRFLGGFAGTAPQAGRMAELRYHDGRALITVVQNGQTIIG